MAKKKPRAKKQIYTKTEQVLKYLVRHPEAPRQQIAAALKLTTQQVSGIIARLRVMDRLPDKCIYVEKKEGDSFTTTDVLAVKKIGVKKVKAIIKLLEAL